MKTGIEMNDENPTPRAVEAEQAVIGALLLDNNSFDRIGDLNADHFYRAEHKLIFSEIYRQISENLPCDVMTVYDKISGTVRDALPYLNAMAQNTPFSANIARYADLVRDKAARRTMIAIGRDMEAMALCSPTSWGELVDKASSSLGGLIQGSQKHEPILAGDDLVRYVEELELRMTDDGRGVSSGFACLDSVLSGLRSGQLIVIAGRPKMGKSGFAMAIAHSVAEMHSVLVLSLEMSNTDMQDRNVSALGRVPLSALINPEKLTDLNWCAITCAVKKIKELKLYIDCQAGLKLIDIRQKAKSHKRKHGLKLLVIDYLQLMMGDASGLNRNSEIEVITRGLKTLAKELDCIVIILSQLNRQVESRPDKRPKPSDLRDSGSIEQDADVVMLVYRDEHYNPDTQNKGVCEIDVALCRQGRPGKAYLKFEGDYVAFSNLHKNWSPQIEGQRTNRRGMSDDDY